MLEESRQTNGHARCARKAAGCAGRGRTESASPLVPNWFEQKHCGAAPLSRDVSRIFIDQKQQRRSYEVYILILQDYLISICSRRP